MLFLGLILGSPVASFGADPCANALVNSYQGLIDNLLKSNEISPERVATLIDSPTPLNPYAGRTLHAHEAIVSKAFQKLIPQLSSTDWEGIRTHLRNRLIELNHSFQHQAVARTETRKILNPRLIGKVENKTSINAIEWQNSNELHMFRSTDRNLKPKEVKTNIPGITVFQSGRKYQHDKEGVISKLKVASPEREGQLAPVEFRLTTFNLPTEQVSIRLYDTGPLQMRPDKPVVGYYIGESLEFARDLPSLTARTTQIFGLQNGIAKLEMEFAMGSPTSAGPIECQVYGDELDCAVVTASDVIFFTRTRGGEIKHKQSLKASNKQWSSKSNYSVSLARLPDGKPIVAVSTTKYTAVYQPTVSAQPISEFEGEGIMSLEWIVLDANYVILAALGTEQSFLVEPFISEIRTPLPVTVGDEIWNHRGQWTLTKDGRILMAIVDQDSDVQIFDLFNPVGRDR